MNVTFIMCKVVIPAKVCSWNMDTAKWLVDIRQISGMEYLCENEMKMTLTDKKGLLQMYSFKPVRLIKSLIILTANWIMSGPFIRYFMQN